MTFAWCYGNDGCWLDSVATPCILIEADNYDEAYRIALATRCGTPTPNSDTLDEAREAFAQFDRLCVVATSELTLMTLDASIAT